MFTGVFRFKPEPPTFKIHNAYNSNSCGHGYKFVAMKKCGEVSLGREHGSKCAVQHANKLRQINGLQYQCCYPLYK